MSLDPLTAAQFKPQLNEFREDGRARRAALDPHAPVSVVADASHHPPPWGWRVSSYFLSKGVAAGAMMLAVLLLVVGARGSALADVVPGVMALAGIAVTGLLLVSDLTRPDRVHYLFLRPQGRSWLAIGAQVINASAVVALAFTVASASGADGARDVLRWVMVPVGAALAGYTALLFNQCEGRDLWQSRLLLPHTIVNAVLAGAGALSIVALFASPPAATERALGWALVAAAVAGGVLVALDTFGRHGTRQAERAARNLWRDLYAARFWAGVTLAGVAPAALGAAFLAPGERGYSRAAAPLRSSACGSTRTPGCGRVRAFRSATMAELSNYPPPERWEDWRELDPRAWPKRTERAYTLVPTVCFNCESACGLLSYVDKETFEIRKLEGNPHHPGSRGRNCAKGPATINQIHDPERILHPLRRKGPRGSGEWERVSWDHVLDTFAGRMHAAFAVGRPNDVMYFFGRPGEDGFADRFLETWGCDGHNSHTNVCSSGGRAGYGLWMGTDRPSPDYANAKFTLLISSHLEAGALLQSARSADRRRAAGRRQARGDRPATVEHRVHGRLLASNLARHRGRRATRHRQGATRRGSDRPRVRPPLGELAHLRDRPRAGQRAVVRDLPGSSFAGSTPGTRPSSPSPRAAYRPAPSWRSRVRSPPPRPRSARISGARRPPATFTAGRSTRALWLLNVLTGSVGTVGGVSANAWHKFIPAPWRKPPANEQWNELSWPREYPLAHNEMSFLYPHFLLDGDRGSPGTAVHARPESDLDLPRRLHVAAGAARRERRRTTRRA